jgi:hypothetical protein
VSESIEDGTDPLSAAVTAVEAAVAHANEVAASLSSTLAAPVLTASLVRVETASHRVGWSRGRGT